MGLLLVHGAESILRQEGPIQKAFSSIMVAFNNFSMAFRLVVLSFLLLSVVYAQDEVITPGGDGNGGENGGKTEVYFQ